MKSTVKKEILDFGKYLKDNHSQNGGLYFALLLAWVMALVAGVLMQEPLLLGGVAVVAIMFIGVTIWFWLDYKSDQNFQD